MKGRKPKPTQFKIIEGNRGHRPLNADQEPKPESASPPCPRELKGDERKAWKYLVQELTKMGTLATSDRGIMSGYCHAWGLWKKSKAKLIELSKELGRDSEVIKASNRNYIKNPWLQIANRSMEDVVKYGAFLGLDPTSRTRIKIDSPKPVSRRERLLGKA